MTRAHAEQTGDERRGNHDLRAGGQHSSAYGERRPGSFFHAVDDRSHGGGILSGSGLWVSGRGLLLLLVHVRCSQHPLQLSAPRPHRLQASETSVGIKISAEHTKATIPGTEVKAVARVTAFDEKTVNFSITCFQGPKFEGQVLSRRRSFAQVLHDRAHARMLRECPMCMHAHALTPCLISTQQHAEETCPQLAGRLALVRACAARGAVCMGGN